ncbi:MAG: DUF192 domain-containing protein [Beijerinckiaceae bacterium]
MATADPTPARSTKWIVALFVAALVGVTGWSLTTNLARERQKEQAKQGQLERLEIASSGGRQVFQIEVMRTAEEKAKGLMFRQFMPEDRGMLFDFGSEQPVSMWMRNTYIPLDMLFIKSGGVVHHIHARAQPLDETPISSNGDVRFVLEINGGVAAKLGLKAGDRVSHQLIGK